jgi:hypothetical protein
MIAAKVLFTAPIDQLSEPYIFDTGLLLDSLLFDQVNQRSFYQLLSYFFSSSFFLCFSLTIIYEAAPVAEVH